MKTSIRAILVYNHTTLHVVCTSSQVYIQHMKFARRTEGVKSARNIFRKAREDSRIGYHVMDWEFKKGGRGEGERWRWNAYLEFKFILHTSGVCGSCADGILHQQGSVSGAIGMLDTQLPFPLLQDKTVAFKIFELGLKRFGDDPNYVLAYVDHLSHLNGSVQDYTVDHFISITVREVIIILPHNYESQLDPGFFPVDLFLTLWIVSFPGSPRAWEWDYSLNKTST